VETDPTLLDRSLSEMARGNLAFTIPSISSAPWIHLADETRRLP
jgi:hypothetical protein